MDGSPHGEPYHEVPAKRPVRRTGPVSATAWSSSCPLLGSLTVAGEKARRMTTRRLRCPPR